MQTALFFVLCEKKIPVAGKENSRSTNFKFMQREFQKAVAGYFYNVYVIKSFATTI